MEFLIPMALGAIQSITAASPGALAVAGAQTAAGLGMAAKGKEQASLAGQRGLTAAGTQANSRLGNTGPPGGGGEALQLLQQQLNSGNMFGGI